MMGLGLWGWSSGRKVSWGGGAVNLLFVAAEGGGVQWEFCAVCSLPTLPVCTVHILSWHDGQACVPHGCVQLGMSECTAFCV
jgi:hypothetical protein